MDVADLKALFTVLDQLLSGELESTSVHVSEVDIADEYIRSKRRIPVFEADTPEDIVVTLDD